MRFIFNGIQMRHIGILTPFVVRINEKILSDIQLKKKTLKKTPLKSLYTRPSLKNGAMVKGKRLFTATVMVPSFIISLPSSNSMQEPYRQQKISFKKKRGQWRGNIRQKMTTGRGIIIATEC